MRALDPRFRIPLIGVLTLLAAVALLGVWRLGITSIGIDFYQFWAVGEAIESNLADNIYSETDRRSVGAYYLRKAQGVGQQRQIMAATEREVFETYSAPFLYTAVHWMASGDYETDYKRWLLLSIGAFCVGVLGIGRLVGLSLPAGLALLAILAVFLSPLHSEVLVANVNGVQLGLITLFLWRQSRVGVAHEQLIAGFVMGLLVMFKPNVLYMIALLGSTWLIRGQIRKLGMESLGLALGAVAAIVSSSFFFGSVRAWQHYLTALGDIPAAIISPLLGNRSLVTFLPDATQRSASAGMAVLLCAVVVALVWRHRHREDPRPEVEFTRDAVLVGAGALVYLLTAPLVWEHYFVLAIPALLIAFAPESPAGEPAIESRGVLDRPRWIATRGVLCALALIALCTLPPRNALPIPNEAYLPLIRGASVSILLGLMLWRLARLGRPVVEATSPSA